MPPKTRPARAPSGPSAVRTAFTRTSPPKTRSGTAHLRTQGTEKGEKENLSSGKISAKTSSALPERVSKGRTPIRGAKGLQPSKSPSESRASQARQGKGGPKKPTREESSPSAVLTSPVEPEQPPWNDEQILDTVETASCDLQGNGPLDLDATTWTERLTGSVEPRTREQNWFRRRGYLPSLDKETLEIIRLVLGKESALKMARQQADEARHFESNLDLSRNVHTDPHPKSDPYVAEIDKISTELPESGAVADVQSRLWTADLTNCEDENEAFFQRTIMMTIINRDRLIYDHTQESGNTEAGDLIKLRGKLAFSTEVAWTCDPMPTRAASRNTSSLPFQAAPKPDLCVFFERKSLIDKGFWGAMPSPLRKLVCYEGENKPHDKRAFGFFVVEAKRAEASPKDNVAKSQALNDASQALHNLFEFFREARQEDVFFERVRVFSATATRTGVVIRIHRAVKLNPQHPQPDEMRPIEFTNPPYDLEFRFEEYASLSNEDFNRQKVVDMSCRILVGYGQRVLYDLLRNAAEKIDDRFSASLQQGIYPADIINDYRHGQIKPPLARRRRKSKATSQGPRNSRDYNQVASSDPSSEPPSKKTKKGKYPAKRSGGG